MKTVLTLFLLLGSLNLLANESMEDMTGIQYVSPAQEGGALCSDRNGTKDSVEGIEKSNVEETGGALKEGA